MGQLSPHTSLPERYYAEVSRPSLRIALIYPPPWKIPRDGAAADPEDGPPDEYVEGDLDADFYQTPYGMLSLAAQALRLGDSVKVFNLSGYAWDDFVDVIERLDADVFGMSCWTANRRGVALTARLIRERHPKSHITIGGPHATPLAREMLEHYPEIDSVVVGEGEETFLELLQRVSRGESAVGLAGAFARNDAGEVIEGPPRAAIHDLDGLACVHEYFNTHIVMTSRGCPWQCTFCGAETTWGRGFRGQSVEYVLDALERAVKRANVKMLQIKDDTFTTNKKRVLALCDGIRERNINFLWSCDTRVDVLSDDLLKAMRLAGCQRLSLGVESGAAAILKNINKKITVDKIIESTELAKKYGIQVRYYMMLGNRGETRETFHETLEFLQRAKPHQYVFSCLSIYPGTVDFHDAEKAGWLDREVYFTGKFQELKTPFDSSEADTQMMNDWFHENRGVQNSFVESVKDCEQILERLGEHHAAYLDLAAAQFRAGDYASSERNLNRALRLGHPTPGVIYDYLACIAHARGDIQGMQDHFLQAAKTDPQHYALMQNVQATRAWFAQGGPNSTTPLELSPQHRFQLFERNLQPALPGPLPEDFAVWKSSSAVVSDPTTPDNDPERRLPIVR